MGIRWTDMWSGRERRGIHARFWWGDKKERNHYKDADVGGIIIIKWIIGQYDVMM
jgi:hypothetical protein